MSKSTLYSYDLKINILCHSINFHDSSSSSASVSSSDGSPPSPSTAGASSSPSHTLYYVLAVAYHSSIMITEAMVYAMNPIPVYDADQTMTGNQKIFKIS